MKLRIVHNTEYLFDDKVFLEPHFFRFKPVNTAYCNLEKFTLDIFPQPAGISERTDSENNDIHFCWFNELQKKLRIKAESIIEVTPFNPFNFLIYPPDYTTLPFQYNTTDQKFLELYIIQTGLNDDLITLANELLIASKYNTVSFILELTRFFFNNFKVEKREKGAPFKPSVTFNKKIGSCRDITWMQINLLRHFGIATKFVSGYYFIETDHDEFELHAWLESYIPGAGWIGFDPTHGIITGMNHIPVCSSYTYENTMPVTGTIRGNSGSKMTNDLLIEKF